VFSAVGLLFADFEVSHSLAFRQELCGNAVSELRAALTGLESKVLAEMRSDDPVRLRWRADLRYRGQGFELPVDIAAPITGEAVAAIRTAFEAEHVRSYGHTLHDHPIDFVSLRVTGVLPPRGPGEIGSVRRTAHAAEGRRPVYFGEGHGLIETPVIDRAALSPDPRPGPLVIEEYEGTTVVPPGAQTALDPQDNIVVTL
jgi:N-methylhydantoinase A